ncbi:MAG: glycoside hydrolase family 16 protein [Eubacterium sp.]|nr:glycoside hydrolase family 16 protein [Eubacterium sp.]MDE6155097.1 glycoside hydrolase family 16 protein [Eubacterium sp.]
MKKFVYLSIITVIIISIALLFGCSKKPDMSWKDKGYDLSVPVLGEDGWYMVFEDDFEGTALNENISFGDRYDGSKEIWTTSPHAIRWKSNDENKPEQACWWCPEMVEVKDSNAIIHSRYEDNHTCNGDCPASGRFTSGIETRIISGDNNNNKGTEDTMLFSQAFGYFECRVKIPNSDGLWSAFWLQSSNQRKVGNEGEDGTEIDVYESAFIKSKNSKMGHALLWDGYGSDSKVDDYIGDIEQDLYDGYHTYALKWTPEYYVFYIDGQPTWATDGGNVSKVKEFLRLTVEIDAGDGWGPHGQKIGQFSHNNADNEDFMIDYVKVWQNENYEQFVRDDDEFIGENDMAN